MCRNHKQTDRQTHECQTPVSHVSANSSDMSTNPKHGTPSDWPHTTAACDHMCRKSASESWPSQCPPARPSSLTSSSRLTELTVAGQGERPAVCYRTCSLCSGGHNTCYRASVVDSIIPFVLWCVSHWVLFNLVGTHGMLIRILEHCVMFSLTRDL